MKHIKKVLAAVLAWTILAGATGCSLFGKKDSKFDEASKKMIQAAEEACEAQEASKKQIKAFKEDDFIPGEAFEKGAYYTFAKEELSDTNFVSEDLVEDDLKNLTVFCKNTDNTCLIACVFELADEDTANDAFEKMSVQLDSFDDELLVKYAEDEGNLDYAKKKKDDEVSVIFVSQEGGTSGAYYLKLEENVITEVQINGTSEEMFSEYYAFMKAADYADQEKLLEKSGTTIYVDTEFEKASQNMVDSAVNTCGAQEATEDQKPAFLYADMAEMKEMLQEGSVFYCYTDEDMVEVGNGVKTAQTCFYKLQGDDVILVYVYEVEDEATAQGILNDLVNGMDESVKTVSAGEKNVVYASDREADQCATIMNYTDENVTRACYAKVQGNVIIASNFDGASDSAMLSEFYAFMAQAGYEDLKTLLETEGTAVSVPDPVTPGDSVGFEEITGKMSGAAEGVWNASEASDVQKEVFKSADYSDNGVFDNAAYYTAESKDVVISDLDSSVIKAGEFTGIYLFCKTQDDSLCMAQVTELQSEELAKAYYVELVGELGDGITEDYLVEQQEAYGIQYGFMETDTEYACVEVLESEGVAVAVYVKCEGKNVVAIAYDGVTGDFLDEYYAFMIQSGCLDMKDLLENGTGEPGAPVDSLVTGDFATDSEAMVQAAISAYGAKEASEEEIAVFADPRFAPNEYNFVQGSYHVFAGEEAKTVTYGIDVLEEGDVVNSAIFYKGYQQQMAFAFVIECKDEAKAKELYDFFDETVFTITEEDFEEYADLVQYGFAYDFENEKAAIFQTKDNYEAAGEYLRIDGNQIILTAYMGTAEDSLLTEYYAFMRQVGYMDMEALLWGN